MYAGTEHPDRSWSLTHLRLIGMRILRVGRT